LLGIKAADSATDGFHASGPAFRAIRGAHHHLRADLKFVRVLLVNERIHPDALRIDHVQHRFVSAHFAAILCAHRPHHTVERHRRGRLLVQCELFLDVAAACFGGAELILLAVGADPQEGHFAFLFEISHARDDLVFEKSFVMFEKFLLLGIMEFSLGAFNAQAIHQFLNPV
jgi:hypothetical protein